MSCKISNFQWNRGLGKLNFSSTIANITDGTDVVSNYD